MPRRLILLLALLPGVAGAANHDVLDEVWNAAAETVYPAALAASHFTPARRARLEAAARRSADLYAFAPAVNVFLEGLGRSHIGLFHDRSVDYYLYRSMFVTRSLDDPPVRHVGLQHVRRGGEWVVREVWDGNPAALAGLRRGDVLLAADGAPYDPGTAFDRDAGVPVSLQVRRGSGRHTIRVQPVWENPNRSLLRAMRASVTRMSVDGRRIGYLHLWAATHAGMLEAYLAALESLADCDALILDLRGGFGGAWYEYLDPFFADRSDFFEATVLSRRDVDRQPVGERTDVPRYDQPLVVLINEGTRSGKEALAFQFRKSGRGVVVGTTTRGAFSAGRAMLLEPKRPYLLLVPVTELLLDGRTIEGVGVAPDERVAFPLSGIAGDPQLARGRALAAELAAAAAAAPAAAADVQPGPTIFAGSTSSSNCSADR
jgi:carboxyl-terminal processing protease